MVAAEAGAKKQWVEGCHWALCGTAHSLRYGLAWINGRFAPFCSDAKQVHIASSNLARSAT